MGGQAGSREMGAPACFRRVRLECAVVRAGGAPPVAGLVRLVGPAAVQVEVPAPGLVPGAEVRLQVRVAGRAEPLAAPARVEWCAPEDAGPGGALAALSLEALGPGPAADAWLQLLADWRPTVLAVDRDRTHLEGVARILAGGYRVLTAETGEAALALLEREEVAVVLTEQRLPDVSGTDFLAVLSRRFPRSHLVRIMASAYTKAEDVQDLINLGRIFHYLRKPVAAGELLQVVGRAADAHQLAVENERLGAELAQANRRLRQENAALRWRLKPVEGDGERLVGQSPALLQALADLTRLQACDAVVHVSGETGTGKELVARAIHDGSARRAGPFVAHNCAALPDALVQSALFGHVKGAFTGADRASPGVFQAADGGTLFLDEVAELSPTAQASLLRVLQQGEVTPVGAARPVRVDVRVVSATHRDLRGEVRAGRFREDLFFRLVVLTLALPPLRERRADVALLATHFLHALARKLRKPLPGFAPATLQALEQYAWPGNVRELRNEVERLAVLGEPGQPLPFALLSPHVREAVAGAAPVSTPLPPPAGAPTGLSYDEAMRAYERALVSGALASTGGVVARAAAALGMERTRLTKLRQRLGLGGGGERP